MQLIEQRWFRCMHCSGTTKAHKQLWDAYLSNREVEVSCDFCHKVVIVTRESEEARVRAEARAKELIATAPIISLEVRHSSHTSQYDGRRRGDSIFSTVKYAKLDIYVQLDGLPEEQHLWQIEGLQTSRIEKKIGATRPYLNAIIGKTLHEARAILAEVKTFAGVQRAASSGAG